MARTGGVQMSETIFGLNESFEKNIFDAIVDRLRRKNLSVKMEIVSAGILLSENPYIVFVREICLRGAVIQIRKISYNVTDGNLESVENSIIDRIDWFAKEIKEGEISECSARVRSQYQAKVPWLWLERKNTRFYWSNTDKDPYPFDLFAELVDLRRHKMVVLTAKDAQEIEAAGFSDFIYGE